MNTSAPLEENGSGFLTRVRLRSYKSIASCSVSLGSLTFLVGRNGSGKSNFLDALRFVRDALRNSVDQAIRERGGIGEVRRRSGGHPNHFGIRLEFRLRPGGAGWYAFQIGAKPDAGFEVQSEECHVAVPGRLGRSSFKVNRGSVEDWPADEGKHPAAYADRLYLNNASGYAGFRPVYEALSRMGFYNLNPEEMRRPQAPSGGELLNRDGSNIASVLATLNRQHPELKRRVEQYLEKVVPGIQGVDHKNVLPMETLEFRQHIKGSQHPWRFLAASMSDGTLRALGVLVSLFQSLNGGPGIPLIGIEEPESALHPAAAAILRDGFRDASERTQVLLTSHSPDLLDDQEIDSEQIIAVQAEAGRTLVAPLKDSQRTALRNHLYTAGELLRMDKLEPDPHQVPDERQTNLFEQLPA